MFVLLPGAALMLVAPTQTAQSEASTRVAVAILIRVRIGLTRFALFDTLRLKKKESSRQDGRRDSLSVVV
jgi:hypothetical protein